MIRSAYGRRAVKTDGWHEAMNGLELPSSLIFRKITSYQGKASNINNQRVILIKM